MKKKMVKKIFSLVCTFVIMMSGCFGYVNVHSKETVKNLIEEDRVIVSETIQEENKDILEDTKDLEEVAEEREESVEPVTEMVEEIKPVPYTVPSLTGNRIEIGSVLQKPLMKDENADHFYLNHNLNGVYDGIGVPYIDFRNDFTGRKTIIYAHSSVSGNGPFQALQNYHNNFGFYQNNRIIKITYNDVEYQYEIFSVYISTADNDESEGLEYFRRMDYSDSEWEDTLQWYKNNSEYDTGVEVHSNDKILILQTCSMDQNYYEKYYRYNLLIMGKLIS